MTRLALLNIPEWTPRKLGNLLLWYDATHIADLSDGDAVTVWKDLANAGEPFYDQFTRADDATTLGNGWTTVIGTPGISGNKAYIVALSSSQVAAVRETGMADCVIACDVTWATGAEIGFRFRVTDSTNFFYCRMNNTNTKIFKVVNNSASELGSYTFSPVNGTTYHMRIPLNGSSVILQMDDGGTLTTRITVTETFNQTATQHGLYAQTSTAGTWDNFIVAKLTDAIQTTAAAKPTYKVNIRNGKPVVRFSAASSQWMAIDNSALPTQDFTVLIVYNATSTTVQKALIGRAYNFGALYMSVVANNDGTNPSKLRLVVDDLNSYSTSGADGAWVIGVGRYDSAENKIYLNGANEDTDANAAGAISYNANDVATIGALRNTAGATASPFDGDIAEILVSSAAFSDASRRRLENYVGKKYRTTITW